MGEDPDTTFLNVILSSFKALSTGRVRKAACHGILDLLTVDEWREVKERADTKLLTRDILGSLPVELVARICQLMDLTDIVALQSVSRRWYELLSSPVICRTALRSHGIYGSYDQLSDEDLHSIFIRHAKKMLRLKLGRACRKASYPARLDNLEFENAAAYCGGRLAWADKDEHGGPFGVALLRLRTGILSRFFTEDREVPWYVRLSESAVAMITRRGDCHVANFITSEQGLFRLPSASIYSFTISGDRVVVIARNRCLYFWDLRSKVVREIALELLPLSMVIHPIEDKITTIHPEHNGSGCCAYYSVVDGLAVTHYVVTGTTITQRQPPTVLRPFPEGTWRSKSFDRVASASGDIGVLPIVPDDDPKKINLTWISYDPMMNTVSVRNVDQASCGPFAGRFDSWRATPVCNDLVYYISPQRRGRDEDDGPYILNLDTGLVHKAKEISVVENMRELRETNPNGGTLTTSPYSIKRTFGDSTFFAWAAKAGFQIYCFDENIDLRWARRNDGA